VKNINEVLKNLLPSMQRRFFEPTRMRQERASIGSAGGKELENPTTEGDQKSGRG